MTLAPGPLKAQVSLRRASLGHSASTGLNLTACAPSSHLHYFGNRPPTPTPLTAWSSPSRLEAPESKLQA